jgi:hypothetical protein
LRRWVRPTRGVDLDTWKTVALPLGTVHYYRLLDFITNVA